MKKISTLIVDDEAPARRRLRDLLDVLSRWCQEDADVVVVPSGTRIVVGND